MIVDGILAVFYGILNVLLAPLAVVNIAVDFVSSIPVFTSFVQVVAYLFPWNNLMPLIILTIAIIGFRTVFSIIRIVWDFIPFV